MMQNNLFLRRLIIVTEDNKYAYDERFHRGVNIIRGQNSSGKSTIIRFIFFVLGGSYGDFVPEALRCQYVMAEIEINGTVITLKRELEKDNEGRVKKNAPMNIYYGSIEEYQTDQHPIKWQRYGYNTTIERRSFSNVLFEIMGLPEFKADSNITMHQILRLIYLDQESPLYSLFLFDLFDKEITRETTANLLMGLYDERLSQAKLDQLALNRRLEELAQAIKYTGDLLPTADQKSSGFILGQIETLAKEIQAITEQVRSLREKEAVAEVKKMEYQKFQQKVAELREKCVQLDTEISRIKADIQDSSYFIDALQKKIEAVDRSIATRNYFDSLHLEFCPECLTPIEGGVEEGHCRLCKSPIDNTKGNSQAIRIKLELNFQIRESQSLLNSLRAVLKEKLAQRKSLQTDLNIAQQQYDHAVRNVRSSQDERIDQLIQDKGYKESEIIRFRDMLEKAEQYEQLLKEEAELREKNSALTREIRAAESRIRSQRTRIEQAIRENGVYLLQNDQDRQAEFRNATDLELDFGQNIVYLTDRHIKLSASSSFYLKMAARFAFFLSSVQQDSMMYPRLILSDNMEDKGMEDSRSQNFQKILVKRLNDLGNPDYQVIFATSMIAPELEKEEYVIGDYYTRENKSLKNV